MRRYVIMPCPDCGWGMVEVNEAQVGSVFFCPKAIGAVEWDKEHYRHYFSEGNPHQEVRRWAWGEVFTERRIA